MPAPGVRALVVLAATTVIGYLIGVIGFYFFTALLDLNLPGGVLGFLG